MRRRPRPHLFTAEIRELVRNVALTAVSLAVFFAALGFAEAMGFIRS